MDKTKKETTEERRWNAIKWLNYHKHTDSTEQWEISPHCFIHKIRWLMYKFVYTKWSELRCKRNEVSGMALGGSETKNGVERKEQKTKHDSLSFPYLVQTNTHSHTEFPNCQRCMIWRWDIDHTSSRSWKFSAVSHKKKWKLNSSKFFF